MSRSYGRILRGGQKTPTTPASLEIQINLTERHTIEQLLFELQRAVHIVQERGAIGVERFRMRLQPLGEDGKPVALLDDDGQQITVIDIPEKPKAGPWRPNEPGSACSLRNRALGAQRPAPAQVRRPGQPVTIPHASKARPGRGLFCSQPSASATGGVPRGRGTAVDASLRSCTIEAWQKARPCGRQRR